MGLKPASVKMSERTMSKNLILKFALLVSCGVSFLTSGCIVAIHEEHGQHYNFDNSLSLKPGMTQEEVIGFLGRPYVIGQKENGDVVFQYQWQEIKGSAVIYGLFVTGENRTVAVNGGEATITFSSDSKLSNKIEYSVLGGANYERLKGPNNGKDR